MSDSTCSIEGCPKPGAARGWCRMHYMRWYKHGDPTIVRPTTPVCVIDGCDRRNRYWGYCQMHARRLRLYGDPARTAMGDWGLDTTRRPGTPEERFNRRVQRGTGCWEWQGARDRDGYGWFTLDRKLIKAHRRSWEIANGPIPDGLWVLHRCDNPPCVRPDHLFLGTVADNVADMIAKGRGRGGAHHGRSTP